MRLALCLVLSAWLPCHGIADDGNALHVLLKDGTSRWFRFDYAPVVTFEGEELTVTSSKYTATYVIDDVVEFRFGDIPTALASPKATEPTVVHIADNTLLVRGTEPDAVAVFDSSGRRLTPTVRCQPDGIEVSLQSLPLGIYIIHINKQSIKVTKR